MRIVVGLVAMAIVIGLVVVLVPVVLTAVLVLFAIAIVFALIVIVRAKIRSAMGLAPKPIIGARARAMREYRAQRAAGVPPFEKGDRENVRVRTGRPAPESRDDAQESKNHESRPGSREVIDGEATDSREVG